jgi:hypothetical protein
VTFTGTESASCVLSGFTICNGKAERGGGIYGGPWEDRAEAVIQHNVITANRAASSGGAVFWFDGAILNNTIASNVAGYGGALQGCDGAIVGNRIEENTAEEDGGGVAGCSGTIEDNTFAGNSARRGGGLYCGAGVIRDNTITGNIADKGGGLYWCSALMENNLIAGNNAGGVVWCYGVIRNNTITGNQGGGVNLFKGTIQNNTIAENQGGGLDACDGTIMNNLISGNSTEYNGGGLNNCSGIIQNNTITGNSAGQYGGGLADCSGTIRNCIIWGNSGTPPWDQGWASVMPTYCCIEDWLWGGRGNTAEDPRFIDPAEGDYHLGPDSPCIDTGINFYWLVWPQQDLDGNCRLHGASVDMGCYECGSSPDSDGDLVPDSEELARGTDPLNDDTDRDALRDGLEKLRQSDPLVTTLPSLVQVTSGVPTIQEALCLAVDGDEIVVAPGTYSECLSFCGVDVILRSSDPGNSAVVHSTVINAEGNGPVVWFAGLETEKCVLSGFTIQGGEPYFFPGAGIYGGGYDVIEPRAARATVENNVITGNATEDYGGGLAYCHGIVRGNTITGNSAMCGGGLYECNGTIENNTITENEDEGLYSCNGIIRNNTISRNVAFFEGGGLYECNGTVEDNTITGNSASRGAGLCGCKGIVQSNLIAWNSADELGGGLYNCDGIVENNTIIGNSAAGDGGGLSECWRILNCIVWGNTSQSGAAQVDSWTEPKYSCIQNWTGGGEGNIADDPQFVDPDGPDDDAETYEDNDYRLSARSPCIDAGVNEDWMWTATDLDGNPRVFRGGLSLTVDMGAYEYASWSFRISEVLVETTGGLRLTWTSRPGDEYVVWSCTDLTSGAWTQEATVPSAGDSTSWTDPSPSGSQKFYKVQQL